MKLRIDHILFTLSLLPIGFMPVYAVSDADLEALEQQLLEQEEKEKHRLLEAESQKQQAEKNAREEARRKAAAEAERRARQSEERRTEEARQAELERQRLEAERLRLQAEQKQVEEERLRQEELARQREEERVKQEVERRLAEEERKRVEAAEAEKKRLAIEAINRLCGEIVGTWRWNDNSGTVSRFYKDGRIVSINITKSRSTWECLDAESRRFTYGAWNVKRTINLESDNKRFSSTGQSGEPIKATKESDDPDHEIIHGNEPIKRALVPLG